MTESIATILEDIRASRFDEAEQSLAARLRVDAHDADALNLMGSLQLKLGRPAASVDYLTRSLALKSQSFGASNNLGSAHFALGDYRNAEQQFRAAAALKPENASVTFNLGNALQFLGKLDEAALSYARALALRPNLLEALCQYVHVRRRMCDWYGLGAYEEQLIAAAQRPNYDASIFPLLALTDDPSIHAAAARALLANNIRSRATPAPRHRAGKIRIAYVSGDFTDHPVAQLLAGVIENHDRHRFEVYGVSFGPPDESESRRRLVAAFDRFMDVRTMTDAEAASLMRGENIDLAVDLTGHTRGARLGIFSYRPAPVQVSYLGYPGTTGADFIDFIIADRVVLPLSEQPFYSEQIVHLPGCFQANDDSASKPIHPFSRAQAGLPEQGFVFCCFNGAFKITPQIFAVWMALLRDFPESVLWLRSDNRWQRDHLCREAATAGVAPNRVIFAEWVKPEDVLARQAAADLFLDTLPYNAHTTASDALRAGVPVLTCTGRTYAARVASSLLTAMGLTDLVARSLEQYRMIAAQIAYSGGLSLRQRVVAARRMSSLFKTAPFTRDLEALYQQLLKC